MQYITDIPALELSEGEGLLASLNMFMDTAYPSLTEAASAARIKVKELEATKIDPHDQRMFIWTVLTDLLNQYECHTGPQIWLN